MRVGYARTSTIEQVAGLEAQLRDLKAAGCDRIFQEQLSSVDAKRPQLEAAIDYARDNDVLVVTKLDRLARSVAGVLEIAKRLKDKGAAVLILDPRLSNATPGEELVFNVLASVAQFERSIMLERQREGIAKAKSDGRYKGRAPTVRNRTQRILELAKAGMSAETIAEELNKETDARGKPIGTVSARSVYRVLADAKRTLKKAA